MAHGDTEGGWAEGTEERPWFVALFGPMASGANQDEPFQVGALPLWAAATQKEAEGQGTDSGWPRGGSMEFGVNQEGPVEAAAAMVMETPLAAETPEASVTSTAKAEVPTVVGVPEMARRRRGRGHPGDARYSAARCRASSRRSR